VREEINMSSLQLVYGCTTSFGRFVSLATPHISINWTISIQEGIEDLQIYNCIDLLTLNVLRYHALNLLVLNNQQFSNLFF